MTKKLLFSILAIMACVGTSYGQLKVIANGNVGIGVTNPAEDLEVAENAIVGSQVGTGDAFIKIGGNRTLEGNAYFDLVADINTNPNYGLRFFRETNGTSRITHLGTQNMVFNAPDGGIYEFRIFGSSKVEFAGGAVRPGFDNATNLGQLNRRWAAVFAANGTIQTSDKNMKSDIKDLEYGLKEVLAMRPVRYLWKNNPEIGNKIGLIAQEVKPIVDEVVWDFDLEPDLELLDEGIVKFEKVPSDRMGLNYAELVPVLINAIQDQQEIIDEKDQELQDLKDEVAEIKALVEQLADNGVGGNINNGPSIAFDQLVINGDSPALAQNTPNPFKQTTSIAYFIPEKAMNSEIRIFSQEGKLMKTFAIDGTGEGILELSMNDLPAGVYSYSLVVDNRLVDTKRMILSF